MPTQGSAAGREPTKIQECEFPGDLLYDDEGLTWAREERNGHVVVGITTILAAVAGKLTSITPKPEGQAYARGKAIGAIESGRYFGLIRTPVGGTLVAVNGTVVRRPKTLSEDPYGEGWFARVRPSQFEDDKRLLKTIDDATALLRVQIGALRVRCFAAFPDYEMFEIGVECAAVLVKLNELIGRIDVGDVIHIVSDDGTAPIEMVQWSEEREQPVVESRREGNLYHFLVRKVR